MIRVLLADDHRVVRQGLKALIEREPDLGVVGEAADGLEAIELAVEKKPDVMVIDLMMPGLPGAEVVRRISKLRKDIRVVVLSMHADKSYVAEALDAGASAYVLKDASAGDLVEAIRSVIAGRKYFSPPLTQEQVDSYRERLSTGRLDAYSTLSKREREVLQLVAEGHTNKEVADRLSISPRTAESHRASLMKKLGLDSTADLVRYAARRGLVSLE